MHVHVCFYSLHSGIVNSRKKKHNRLIVQKFIYRMKNITISRTLRRWMEYVSETKNARSLVHRVVKTFKHKSMSMGYKKWLQYTMVQRNNESLEKLKMLYEIKVGHYKEWSVKWMQKSHESLELANHLKGDLDEIHSNMPSIYDFMVQGGKLSIEKNENIELE